MGIDVRESTHSPSVVALVDSPLQAVNLLEYCERFGRRLAVVVVGDADNERARIQMDAVLSPAKPGKIMYLDTAISLRANLRKKRTGRPLVAAAEDALRGHMPTNEPFEFVVGEYRSVFAWALLHSIRTDRCRVVVVDDGDAMLRLDRRSSSYLSGYQWGFRCRALVHRSLGLRGVIPPSGLTFFTAFQIGDRLRGDDALIRNDYRVLASELRQLPPDEGTVFLIGAPHREAGIVGDCDLQLALDLVRFAKQITAGKLVYVAHRREESRKLDALRAEVEVETPSVPFELYPRIRGRRPITIIGYYSSLFTTMATLLGNAVEIVALRIPRNLVIPSQRAIIDTIYQTYREDYSSVIRVVEQRSNKPII